MMHDNTLDRTTTCKGKVNEFYFKELIECNLKDIKNEKTKYKIDTLEDAIIWSKDRTILNIDVKDVTYKQKIDLVKKHDAFKSTIFTVHNSNMAKEFFDYEKNSLFSAWILDEKAFEDFDKSNIPWENIMVAYVGSKITEENKKLKNMLHDKGVMVMISTAPVYDKIKNKKERIFYYQNIIKEGFDIIETDRPIEISQVIGSFYPVFSTKYQYIQRKIK